jgi:hypothetical protein
MNWERVGEQILTQPWNQIYDRVNGACERTIAAGTEKGIFRLVSKQLWQLLCEVRFRVKNLVNDQAYTRDRKRRGVK